MPRKSANASSLTPTPPPRSSSSLNPRLPQAHTPPARAFSGSTGTPPLSSPAALRILTSHPSGLEFTSKALRKNLDNQSEELAASFTNAYGETLKQHHNFVVKGIFGVAMKACPYRDDFYKKLGGEDVTKTQAQMQEWVAALEGIVSILTTYLATLKW